MAIDIIDNEEWHALPIPIDEIKSKMPRETGTYDVGFRDKREVSRSTAKRSKVYFYKWPDRLIEGGQSFLLLHQDDNFGMRQVRLTIPFDKLPQGFVARATWSRDKTSLLLLAGQRGEIVARALIPRVKRANNYVRYSPAPVF